MFGCLFEVLGKELVCVCWFICFYCGLVCVD